MKKNGFTLVEILIALTILIMLAIAMIGIINPIALVNRGNDGLRKKHLYRIRAAFEEFYNDKGYYLGEEMVDKLMNDKNCGTNVFAPWLNQWPCDPLGQTYYIDLETDDNGNVVAEPKWFKVFTNLQDKKDKEIPVGWYSEEGKYQLANYLIEQVNFGVSSPNVLWYDFEYQAVCHYRSDGYSKDGCFQNTSEFGCTNIGTDGCQGDNCYSAIYPPGSFLCVRCKVPCCGTGEDGCGK